MLLLLVALVLILCGLVAALFAWRGESSLIAMRETETVSIAEVIARHRVGRLGQLVEVVGTSECDAPLRAPYSETTCLAYDYVVSNEKEQNNYRPPRRPHDYLSWGSNNHGSYLSDRERYSVSRDIDMHDQRVPRFYVRDASGRIAVDTAGAEMDLLETAARFESYTSGDMNVERHIWREEHALPLGNRVYILATLADEAGEPVLMRHPVDRSRRFIISHRDERTFLNRTRLRTYGLYLFSGVAIGAGLIVAAFGLGIF
ncbi:MAG: hypothetical protein HGB28_03800 [Oscillochloris sp.]|nr:hypothetical protein [Oscillochloris sp.]